MLMSMKQKFNYHQIPLWKEVESLPELKMIELRIL
ncbi:hypothetical protein GcC1_199055 [Golovinomyces cichoracearum]|uniref:Uncharacterized protein n=1 Tax=Golovinomyces cichoracearum TaxID=62708 RepID=A0A420HFB3_9PEZI|nr:hypothetical protein GcC1_199055 [Golovinomyces cichoracearum]